ncbi:MAG TPA: hypothetical protein PKC96_06520 [Bacilli bacterium]|nr:hypothetical protein [Bacilli bacterium]
MKKTKLYIITFASVALILSGCGRRGDSSSASTGTSASLDTSLSSSETTSISTSGSSPTSNTLSNSSIESVMTTIYFNLTRYGLFNGQHGTDISAKNLEFGYEYTALSGSLLPNSDVITHELGAEFSGWVYQSSSGGLIKFDEMPATEGIVLQAWFKDTDPSSSSESLSSESSGSESSSEETNSGLYLDLSNDEMAFLVESYSTAFETTEWTTEISVEKDTYFSIKSLGDKFGIGDDTYPSYAAGYRENNVLRVGYTLDADASNGLYTADILTPLTTADESGSTDTGATYFKYINNMEPQGLSFKKGGTFALYIRFYNDYSWVSIWAEEK